MEIPKTAKFDHSLNCLEIDTVPKRPVSEKKRVKKRIRKPKTKDLHIHEDLIAGLFLYSYLSQRFWKRLFIPEYLDSLTVIIIGIK